MPETTPFRYPRKKILRGFLRLLGSFLMWLLTRTTINGRENFPRHGPLLLVGNHVAMIEAVMMVVYAPWLVEMIGAGDIPLDARFAPFVHGWGVIPIKRGSMDREGLNIALDVLQQGGIIGIFPEGGIWETSLKQGRTGVAWLSYKANAPIVPIGFGGMVGALNQALTFKRPRLVMNVGEPIPPITLDGKSRKQALDDGAAQVMERIEALIPEEEKARRHQIFDERFEFVLEVHDQNGECIPLPAGLALTHPEALGQFFHRPVLLTTLARNLHLPVQALQNLDTNAAAVASAAQTVLDYLTENPYFFSYRFGYDVAEAMQTSLTQLRDTARWAAQSGYSLTLNPIRRYRPTVDGDEIVEEGTKQAHQL